MLVLQERNAKHSSLLGDDLRPAMSSSSGSGGSGCDGGSSGSGGGDGTSHIGFLGRMAMGQTNQPPVPVPEVPSAPSVVFLFLNQNELPQFTFPKNKILKTENTNSSETLHSTMHAGGFSTSDIQRRQWNRIKKVTQNVRKGLGLL